MYTVVLNFKLTEQIYEATKDHQTGNQQRIKITR